MLELTDVRKVRRGEEVLKGISITMPFGQVFCLVGPNGAGKSTLLEVLLSGCRVSRMGKARHLCEPPYAFGQLDPVLNGGNASKSRIAMAGGDGGGMPWARRVVVNQEPGTQNGLAHYENRSHAP